MIVFSTPAELPSSKDFRVEGLQELDLRQLVLMSTPAPHEGESEDEEQEDFIKGTSEEASIKDEGSEERDPMKVETSEEN